MFGIWDDLYWTLKGGPARDWTVVLNAGCWFYPATVSQLCRASVADEPVPLSNALLRLTELSGSNDSDIVDLVCHAPPIADVQS